jgi:hypothetical protein
LPAAQLRDLDRGRHCDPHPAAGGEHVHRAVVEAGQEYAITTGWLSQPIDLFAQREELATSLPQRLHQFGVALSELAHRRGGLGEALLEQPEMPGRLGQSTTQQRHLILEDPDLGGQRWVDAFSTVSGSVAGIVVRHEAPPPAWFWRPLTVRDGAGEP